jgi:hypothetical protein
MQRTRDAVCRLWFRQRSRAADRWRYLASSLRFRISSFRRSNSSGVIGHSGHLVTGFAFPVTYDRHSVPHPLHTVMIGFGGSGLLVTEHPANASVANNSAAR